MYGEWVTINLGLDVECRVWVACIPGTSQDALQRLALNQLKSRLPKEKTGVAAGMEALSVISDYEYSQGRGLRWKAEQELNEMIKSGKLEEYLDEVFRGSWSIE